MKMNINVIGLGFVGLTTALSFANKNIKVMCVENNSKRLHLLKKQIIPFEEPSLKIILKKSIKKNKIFFEEKFKLDRKSINIFFLCIGTPSKKTGQINLNQITNFLKNFKKNYRNEKIIFVVKSTVPPGTISQILNPIFKGYNNISFCSNPEFLREGYAWQDVVNADKIVIGSSNLQDFKILKRIYKNFSGQIIKCSSDTAEYIKYLSNSLLATLISFSNEITMLAEINKHIDVKSAFRAVKLDKRWFGNPAMLASYLHPGLGYGGYCLPKDLEAINYLAKKNNLKNGILEAVNRVNKKILNHHVKKINNRFKKNNKIAILGISFKPKSDDIRGSKSLELIRKLKKIGYKKIYTYDPVVKFQDFPKDLKFIKHSNKLNKDANKKYILCTAWPEYINFIKKNKNFKFLDFRYVI